MASLKIPTPPCYLSNGPSFMQHMIALDGSQKIYMLHSSGWKGAQNKKSGQIFCVR